MEMQQCKITLTTSADGEESQITRTGSVLLTVSKAIVCYREENAEITLTFENGGARIERRGDYELSLFLEEGKACDGMLGLGGALGTIRTDARKISYSIGKDSLLAILHYDFIFGAERQEMKLRLYVKTE